MQTAPGRRLLAALATGALIAACGPGDRSALQAEVDANRAKWQAAAITRYTVVQGYSCHCPGREEGKYTTRVRDGEVVSAVSQLGNEVPAEELHYHSSIESLFDDLDRAIRERYHDVYVRFDAELGYPATLSLDPDGSLEGEEFGIVVTELQPDE